MAKSKKAETSAAHEPADADKKGARKAPAKTEAEAVAGPARSAARKPPGKKQPDKPAAPLIDTSLAAEAAARLVGNRDLLAGAQGDKRESGAFKQLKESLNKPAAHGPASFLHSTSPQKKLNLPFGGRKQVGHNQTFGADVNRAGVPRRTGG